MVYMVGKKMELEKVGYTELDELSDLLIATSLVQEEFGNLDDFLAWSKWISRMFLSLLYLEKRN